MDLRWMAALALLTLSGCLADTAQTPPGTAEADGPAAASESTETVGRQSRAGAAAEAERADPDAPFSWHGETNVAVCVEVSMGCAGFTEYHSPGQRVPAGPGPSNVRVTVTWTPTGQGTEELVLDAGGQTVRGPSPLVLELQGVRSAFEAYVTVPHDVPVAADTAGQPFDGLAEFS